MANNQATIEDLLDELYDIMEDAKPSILLGGKSKVDCEEIRQILDDLRDVIPDEIRKARSIVDEREKIIADAHAEAEATIKAAERKADVTIKDAEREAERLVNKEEIVKRANARANEIEKKGQDNYRISVTSTYNYVETLLKATEEELTRQKKDADEAFAKQLGDIREMSRAIEENKRKELKSI